MPSELTKKLPPMSVQEIYDVFTTPDNGYPNWPSLEIQRGYTGTNQLATLRQALGYLELMDNDGAFVKNWRGLDYACGWGRFASSLLKYGNSSQLDLVDAWPRTITIIEKLGYKNDLSVVSELIKKGELPARQYDFALSFSLFTHLNKEPFVHNLKMLAKTIKKNGRVYFTVRHDNFFDHKYEDKAKTYRKELKDNDGFWFIGSGGDQTGKGYFGDTVVTQEFLNNIDPKTLKFRYLGAHVDLQKMYVMELV